MDKSNVYIGTIKRCLDVEKYKEYGEEYEFPQFEIGSMKIGTILPTVNIYNNQAILIKTSKGYVELQDVYGLFAKKRIEKNKWIISNEPQKNGELFVDELTVKPYYLENVEEKINFKRLKLEASKFRGGFQN